MPTYLVYPVGKVAKAFDGSAPRSLGVRETSSPYVVEETTAEQACLEVARAFGHEAKFIAVEAQKVGIGLTVIG